MKNKKINLKDKRKLRKLVEEPFRFYGEKVIYEEEFFEYFRRHGWSEDDIERLWVFAVGEGIVRFGVSPEADEFPPRKIRGRVILELVE